MDTVLRIIFTTVLSGILCLQVDFDHAPSAANRVGKVQATETSVERIRRPIQAPESIDPLVFEGATAEQVELVNAAISMFESHGLELPPLVVSFDLDGGGCNGHVGFFTGGAPARIELCTELRHIVLHELAHAWEWHSVDDVTRDEFVEQRGLPTWNSKDHEWAERGVENFADTVALGMMLMNSADNTAVIERVIGKLCTFEQITAIDHPASTDADCGTSSALGGLTVA